MFDLNVKTNYLLKKSNYVSRRGEKVECSDRFITKTKSILQRKYMRQKNASNLNKALGTSDDLGGGHGCPHLSASFRLT